ncbi:MAG: SDR family oxidoreductase [Wenzhouxiangella sp.]|jgi:nucleoside-diphosphate-sugar epimerase|nr:SDR family oxidoreductase [Wenzhouxiangella sp.]
MKQLLIAGFGDLGQRLSARLTAASNWQVHALRRSSGPGTGDPIYHRADLTRPETLSDLPARFDAIVYQATPSERSPEAYRSIYIEGLGNLLARTATDQLLMVSSTAVYGQDEGEWVDESSITTPRAFNGEILFEAERLALAAGGRVVRFSGIYGPGRDALIRRLQSGQARCSEAPVQWTNRIHADDAAATLAHLLERPALGPVVCASDDRPSPRCEVLDWLADRLGCPPPLRENGSGAGKRVSNALLRASGFEFTYPDYRTGYQGLLP